VTAHAEAAPLDAPLHALPERRRRGRSQAPPGEWVGLAPAEGGHRPLGTPTCEATMVQRAGARGVDAIDAPDWSDGS
jgi:hypothetical protein